MIMAQHDPHEELDGPEEDFEELVDEDEHEDAAKGGQRDV